MPLYEYECLECGARFEKLIKSAREAGNITCPHCACRKVEEQISSFSSTARGGAAVSSKNCAPGGG